MYKLKKKKKECTSLPCCVSEFPLWHVCGMKMRTVHVYELLKCVCTCLLTWLMCTWLADLADSRLKPVGTEGFRF